MALGYGESVELCRTAPRFEVYASLPVEESTSGIWQSRQLFLASPSAVLAVFTDPAQGFVQVRSCIVLLALLLVVVVVVLL